MQATRKDANESRKFDNLSSDVVSKVDNRHTLKSYHRTLNKKATVPTLKKPMASGLNPASYIGLKK